MLLSVVCFVFIWRTCWLIRYSELSFSTPWMFYEWTKNIIETSINAYTLFGGFSAVWTIEISIEVGKRLFVFNLKRRMYWIKYCFWSWINGENGFNLFIIRKINVPLNTNRKLFCYFNGIIKRNLLFRFSCVVLQREYKIVTALRETFFYFVNLIYVKKITKTVKNHFIEVTELETFCF